MTKYTKRQYQADIATNDAQMERALAEVARIEAKFENGTNTEDDYDLGNAAYDLVSAIEIARKDIDRRWSQRNWGAHDFAMRELISANAD